MSSSLWPVHRSQNVIDRKAPCLSAEDGHKAASGRSPKSSPRRGAQTPSAKPPLSSGPQAEALPPALKALPHPALSPSLPSQPQVPSAANQASSPSASAQPREISHNLPTSASSESPNRPHAPPAEPPHEASHLSNSAGSESQPQPRADLNESAQPHHQKAHPGLSVRTSLQSPAGSANQEMLAGLGSALRAQARLRRKAVAPDTTSPDDQSSVTARLGEVSPSGQLSFEDVELKSKGVVCPLS